MHKRKWQKSPLRILSLADLQICTSSYGGIWFDGINGRFFNKAWVVSQQLNYLLHLIECGHIWFPMLTQYGMDILKEKGD